MTSRERFLGTLAGRPVDRPPLWEEGIREDVIEAWKSQGAPDMGALRDEFAYDQRVLIQPEIRSPRFNILPTDTDSDDPPADDPARYPDDWADIVAACHCRDFPVGLRVSRGLLLTLGVGEWKTLKPVLLALADEPDRAAHLMKEAARFALEVFERAFDDITFDYAILSEPIAGASGPVVGPWTFRRICTGACCMLIEALRQRGVRHIIMQSYGNPLPLLPEAVRMGCTAVWIGETTNTATDVASVRAKVGTGVGIIGGIRPEVLALGESDMARRLRSELGPALHAGRYLPLLDGRVRSDVPFERYRTYRRTLVQVVTELCERPRHA